MAASTSEAMLPPISATSQPYAIRNKPAMRGLTHSGAPMITRPITRPITSPIARAVTAAYGAWNPRALFALGEQGVLYDPNDLSTLFQDSAGTTPVTAAGQPVGLMLDKRLGLVRGAAEAISHDASWTSSSGTYTKSVAGFGALGFASASAVGKTYIVDFTVAAITAGSSIRLYRRNAANSANEFTVEIPVTAGGKYSAIATVVSESAFDLWLDSGTFAGSISGLSFRELPGQHGVQSTAAARMMLRDSPVRHLDSDMVDDSLNVAFPVSLGSSVTIGRSIPGVGASISANQTVGTSYSINTDFAALVIVNRTLSAPEYAMLARYLDRMAGV